MFKNIAFVIAKVGWSGGGGFGTSESFTTCPYRNSNLQKFAYSIAAFFIFFSQNKLQLHVEELREEGDENKKIKQKTRRWQFIKPGLENGCPMSCTFYGLWSDPGIKQVSEGNLLFPLPYG